MGTPRWLVLTGWIVAELDPAARVELVATALALVGLIGLGIAAFVWARNWWRRLAEDTTAEDPIETYRHMLDEGLIDQREFDRIEAQLAGRPELPVTGIRSGTPPRSTDLRPGPPPPEPPSESAP